MGELSPVSSFYCLWWIWKGRFSTDTFQALCFGFFFENFGFDYYLFELHVSLHLYPICNKVGVPFSFSLWTFVFNWSLRKIFKHRVVSFTSYFWVGCTRERLELALLSVWWCLRDLVQFMFDIEPTISVVPCFLSPPPPPTLLFHIIIFFKIRR